jgi:hypothetical protein
MTMRGFFQNLGGDCHMYTLAKEKEKRRKKTGIYFAPGFISFDSFLPVQRCPLSFFELVAQQSVSLLFA